MPTIRSPLTTPEGARAITGWGRTAPTVATIAEVASVEDVQREVASGATRAVLARGLGRSYGDAAQSGGGTLIDLGQLSDIHVDTARGLVTVGAGVSLDRLLRVIVPAGFFVPVSPGTRMVTVGGAIAADVHGKNHHVDGTFGSHVHSLEIVDGTGAVRVIGPDPALFDRTDVEDFWATVGGMGLTGVITRATFDLIPITTAMMSVDTVRCPDLDGVMARMVDTDGRYRYSVAWIDSVAPSGRGIVTDGEHAPVSMLAAAAPRKASRPLDYDPRALGTIPAHVPSVLLNRHTVRAFNEAWFRMAPRQRDGELQSLHAFFHPLDGVQEWNRLYGSGGFLQYQFVVPDSGTHLVERALARLQQIGAASFLTVLKRFGPQNPAPLSFPTAGWTLTADVPATVPGLARVLDELDAEVLAEGGRLYLAKDSRMSPEMMAASYPRLDEWRAIRDRMDPKGVFASDLSRRLGL